jgi:fructokinase
MLPGGRVASGAPMNVALRLAHSGYDVRMLSRVGADSLGDELLSFMAENGLSTDCVQRDENQPTGTVRVDTTNPGSPVFDIVMPVAWDFIDADEYFRKTGVAADVLVFGTLAARHSVSRDALVRLLPTARLKVIDVNFRPPHDERSVVELLLHHADWAKVNETELARIAGWHGPAGSVESSARELVERYGLSSLCATLGDEGALLLHGDAMYRQEAFPVDVVDAVGCGDAFLGTLIACLLGNVAPAAALVRAAAVGALVAGSAGATPDVSGDDIRRLLESTA